MILNCTRCKNQWDYKGKSQWYASCSMCKTNIKITDRFKGNSNEGS